MSAIAKRSLLVVLCAQVCTALYAAKGSPCAVSCNSTGGSWVTDLVCSTDDFASTTKGQTLQSCLECTVDSTYVNSSYTDGNSDQFWMLFHLKYVQQHCLIDTDTPHIAAVNACTSACSPLGDVLETLWINKHPFVGQYDYCSLDSSAYTDHAADCARCLQGQEESVVIGNFVDTMNQACASRPLAANGELISPTRALFETSIPSSVGASSTGASTSSSSTTATGTNSRTSTTSSTTQGGTASTGSSAAHDNSETDKSSEGGGLSTGAAAGIGAGIAVLAIGVIAGLVFLFLRRRRTTKQVQPQSQSWAAAEMSANSTAQGVKHEAPAQEKPAWGSEEQLHEAPSDAQSRFELPAPYKR
ncbi:hypothetical protein LTR70_007773 [Exophiala xenobiotica]|uniref:LPXTG-domain-containing protein n=1 Tax=Lithohypha guttulata TaxID=1690604 RepID=A0ABR0K2T4_9EURO|nr:hypothetical protein LTR24_007446 [Lithohypha guttulata]KAK5313155.1 hypothetical protein LTR70_007773 [Exophiala xenobiotica]